MFEKYFEGFRKHFILLRFKPSTLSGDALVLRCGARHVRCGGRVPLVCRQEVFCNFCRAPQRQGELCHVFCYFLFKLRAGVVLKWIQNGPKLC